MNQARRASESASRRLVLDAWAIHNRINLFLIARIPGEGFRAAPAGSRGRTVAEQLLHMHRVRLGWLHYHMTGKRPARPKVSSRLMTRVSLRKSFTESGKRVSDFLARALDGAIPTRAFARNPVRWMGYLISHESHHRGQILLALKQNRIRMPDDVVLQGLWGKWMWGK